MPKQEPTADRADAAGFAATRWTLVLAAAEGKVSPRAAEEIEELCRLYILSGRRSRKRRRKMAGNATSFNPLVPSVPR